MLLKSDRDRARPDRLIGFTGLRDLEEAENGSKAANNVAP
jgi:hypothetical protein